MNDDIEITKEEVVNMFCNHPSVPDCDKKLIACDPTMQDRAYEFAKYVINLYKKRIEFGKGTLRCERNYI